MSFSEMLRSAIAKPLSEDQLAKMRLCGNCDRDQENLCNDCPARIPASELMQMAEQVHQQAGTVAILEESHVIDDKVLKIMEAYRAGSNFTARRSEQLPILGQVGNVYVPPEPMLQGCKPAPTMRDHARRLLSFRDKRNNALEITTLYPETITILDRYWQTKEESQLPMADKKREIWIGSHPFMQYITQLLRIRLLPAADTSYRQNENIMEGIAEL